MARYTCCFTVSFTVIVLHFLIAFLPRFMWRQRGWVWPARVWGNKGEWGLGGGCKEDRGGVGRGPWRCGEVSDCGEDHNKWNEKDGWVWGLRWVRNTSETGESYGVKKVQSVWDKGWSFDNIWKTNDWMNELVKKRSSGVLASLHLKRLPWLK